MSTLFRFKGLKIVIYSLDHRPAHVHIIGPDVDAKVEIGSWNVVHCEGLSAKSLKKVIEFLRERESDLWEAWNEIHE
jgi:hypothetical protein